MWKIITIIGYLAVLIINFSRAVEEKKEENFFEILDVLDKFIEYVEAHKLNVSVVGSTVDFWWNKNIKSVNDLGINLPPNQVHLTESTLTTEAQKKWSESVKSLKNPMVIGSWHRYYKPNDPQLTNDPSEVIGPNTPTYKRIVNNLNGKQNFLVDEYNIFSEYNINIENDTKYQRATITGGNITVFALEVHGIPRGDVEKIEEVIADVYNFYEEDEDIAIKLADILDEKFSENNWQTIVGIKDLAVASSKWAVFEVARERKILIFT